MPPPKVPVSVNGLNLLLMLVAFVDPGHAKTGLGGRRHKSPAQVITLISSTYSCPTEFCMDQGDHSRQGVTGVDHRR